MVQPVFCSISLFSNKTMAQGKIMCWILCVSLSSWCGSDSHNSTIQGSAGQGAGHHAQVHSVLGQVHGHLAQREAQRLGQEEKGEYMYKWRWQDRFRSTELKMVAMCWGKPMCIHPVPHEVSQCELPLNQDQSFESRSVLLIKISQSRQEKKLASCIWCYICWTHAVGTSLKWP